MTTSLEYKIEDTQLFEQLQIANAIQHLLSCYLSNEGIEEAYHHYSSVLREYGVIR